MFITLQPLFLCELNTSGWTNPKSKIQNEKMRVFIAIELPENIRELAAKHNRLLRESVPRVRAGWESIEKMHITLKFLGEIDEKQLDDVQKTVEETAKEFHSFELSIVGTGAFPTRGVPRILWLGVSDGAGFLSKLQSRIETKCAEIGFKREKREFHPHITLARIRTAEGARSLGEKHKQIGFQSEQFSVNEIIVMRSELLQTTSQYTKLSIHPFLNHKQKL